MSFYRLNKDYIASFQKNVLNRYNSDNKRIETSLLRAILKEVTDLFRKVGGQLSSKRNIPKAADYPNSKIYNALIKDIGFDIDKIYNAQTLVESDINNLLNFNETQRKKTFDNYSSAQQAVYSAYIRSKKDLIGGVEVPAGSPFASSSDSLGKGSDKVYVDITRTCLTLDFKSEDKRIADTKYTSVYFIGTPTTELLYPSNNGTLGIGHHWKLANPDSHLLDQKDETDVLDYKTMMIDDPDSNTGVGFCEFEAIETLGTDITNNIKDQIGLTLSNLDPDLVYVDVANSFQGAFVNNSEKSVCNIPKIKYKLTIPFSTEVLSNSFTVVFMTGSNADYPKINWTESKIFSNIGGADMPSNFLPPSDLSEVGQEINVCNFVNFIYPTRAELILEYASNPSSWKHVSFIMSQYVWVGQTTYQMTTSTDTNIGVNVKRQYDIFVDTEANSKSEQTRAWNVLVHTNKTED